MLAQNTPLAQDTPPVNQASAPADTNVQTQAAARVKPGVDSTTGVDTTKHKARDAQNQLKFLQPDMESRKYNFYERRAISTPEMPRYDTDSAPFQDGKKRRRQQNAYLNNQYFFPARPKDAWEIGFNLGAAFVSGDVQPKVYPFSPFDNAGVGISVRKSFGYIFSIRAEYMYQVSTGRNWQPDYNLEFNKVLHPDPNSGGTPNGPFGSDTGKGIPNYYDNPNLTAGKTEAGINTNGFFFYNYRTHIHDLSLQGILNVGNINFHKERNIVNIYAIFGVDAYLYATKYDALNSQDEVYDFSPELAFYESPAGTNTNVNGLVTSKRKELLKMLNNLYGGDGNYNVWAEQDRDLTGFGHWALVPSFTIGAGIAFHATKFMSIALEERVIWSQRTDLVDGDRWLDQNGTGVPTLVPHGDNLSYTSLNFLFNLLGKKRTEPLYWMNPIYYSYRKIGEVNPQALADELFRDDDSDGVPNILDREPNTKKGCPVDAHGVILDSDHDGIPDCEDKEPFSPPGYPVDSNGVAIIPPNPCCDTTRFYNKRGPNGLIEQAPPGELPVTPAHINDCSKIDLPMVVFDGTTYYVDPQYYGNLHQIAERMQLCPDIRIVVTGYGEAKPDQKFNEQLGWNRANAAVDYLVEKYGISRDRFIIKYVGSKKAATGTLYERRMKNKVDFRYANEGETGESNPPAPHPGIKAGQNK